MAVAEDQLHHLQSPLDHTPAMRVQRMDAILGDALKEAITTPCPDSKQPCDGDHCDLCGYGAGVGDAVRLEDFYAYAPEGRFIFVPTRETWPASSVDKRLHWKMEHLDPCDEESWETLSDFQRDFFVTCVRDLILECIQLRNGLHLSGNDLIGRTAEECKELE